MTTSAVARSIVPLAISTVTNGHHKSGCIVTSTNTVTCGHLPGTRSLLYLDWRSLGSPCSCRPCRPNFKKFPLLVPTELNSSLCSLQPPTRWAPSFVGVSMPRPSALSRNSFLGTLLQGRPDRQYPAGCRPATGNSENGRTATNQSGLTKLVRI